MVWALINDSDGRAVAIAETQAELSAGTGQTVVEATHPIAFGYKYNTANQTWSARDDFFAPGQELVTDIPNLVRDRCAELNLLIFSGSSQAQNRTYVDHLANAVSAARVPSNQTDKTKIETIRREIELHAGEWVLRATGFAQGLTPTEFAVTVTPETGAWTRSTDTTIAVEPRAFANRGEFLLEFVK